MRGHYDFHQLRSCINSGQHPTLRFAALHESTIGPKQTQRQCTAHVRFRGNADVPNAVRNVR
jgi:hypothetical protein